MFCLSVPKFVSFLFVSHTQISDKIFLLIGNKSSSFPNAELLMPLTVIGNLFSSLHLNSQALQLLSFQPSPLSKCKSKLTTGWVLGWQMVASHHSYLTSQRIAKDQVGQQKMPVQRIRRDLWDCHLAPADPQPYRGAELREQSGAFSQDLKRSHELEVFKLIDSQV